METQAPKRRGRPRKNPLPQTESTTPATNPQTDLAQAIVEAIRSTQPITKKTAFTKVSGSPWMPKNGEPRARLKRRAYHHNQLLGDPKEPNCRLSNEEINLFNQLKPGSYCSGYVKVMRRRDKGIDIDYPIRTASQRLRLVNDFGIRSFAELLQKCVTEAAAPKTVQIEDE